METNHVAAVKAAEARCTELAKVEGKIKSRAEAAARKLADAEADERKLAEKFAAAEDAYADQPTTENVNALGKAREALELAKLRLRTPRREHEAAQAELSAWQTSRDAAAAELKTARLRQEGSLELFHERTAEPFKQLLGALEALNLAATQIDYAFASANAASIELGEPRIAPFHLIAPLLRTLAARHGASGLVNHGGFYKAARVCENGLAPALSFSLFDAIGAHARNAGVVPNARAMPLLERVLECRTPGEGDALIAAEEARVKAEAEAVSQKRWQEVDGPAHAREQERLSAEAGGIGFFS